MLAPKITLTREELYEKVWSIPMQKLAVEFGFSDRGFAKLYRRHQIPVPPRGYWARIQVGQSVQRIPLPSVSQANLSTIEINFRERQPAVEGTATEGNGVPTIVVAQDRAISHPITLRIERCFSRTRTDETGLLIPKLGVAVPIHVSVEQLPRALRIWDTLLDVLEQAKHQLDWPTPHNERLKVKVLEESLGFAISEVLEHREHKLTSDEISRQKREPWWHPPRWDYQPTGRLMLNIEGSEGLGIRHKWSDGKRKRIEDVLGHFLMSLVAVATALRRRREEIAEQQHKWAEERKREAEEAARRAEYERRAKAVEGLARSWDQSKSLRAFAERLSSLAGQEGLPEEQRQDIRAMAEWATRHAEYADPFTHVAWMVGQFKNPPWSYGH